MNNTFERRAITSEIRTNGRRLEGYAAIFNTEARIGERFIETIAPNAFSTSLSAGNDILALVDHNTSKMLARTRSGSLRLSEDSRGLSFDLDIPDTQAGRDILALASRGDLGGMSFGFNAIDDELIGNKRELRSVELIEISVVQAFPAYEGTIVNARSKSGRFADPLSAYMNRTIKIMELAQ